VERVLLKGDKIMLFGPNGAGKTNILRAVYLAAKALARASFRIAVVAAGATAPQLQTAAP
jgi:recombinational DNA repair ATPase RecF